jgi:hypothetical protein
VWVRVAHGDRGLAQRVWGLCMEESGDAVLAGDEQVVCLTGEFRCMAVVDLPERGHDDLAAGGAQGSSHCYGLIGDGVRVLVGPAG